MISPLLTNIFTSLLISYSQCFFWTPCAIDLLEKWLRSNPHLHKHFICILHTGSRSETYDQSAEFWALLDFLLYEHNAYTIHEEDQRRRLWIQPNISLLLGQGNLDWTHKLVSPYFVLYTSYIQEQVSHLMGPHGLKMKHDPKNTISWDWVPLWMY